MCKLLFFLIVGGLAVQAAEPALSAPSCAGMNIVFHGEIRWGQIEINDQGQKQMKKFREVRPLPNSHTMHSDSWKRILVRVPPEKRSEVHRWSLEAHGWQNAHDDTSRKSQSFSFGGNEEGFYPVEDLEFDQLVFTGSQMRSGLLVFVIKKSRNDICQFEINVNGRGD